MLEFHSSKETNQKFHTSNGNFSEFSINYGNFSEFTIIYGNFSEFPLKYRKLSVYLIKCIIIEIFVTLPKSSSLTSISNIIFNCMNFYGVPQYVYLSFEFRWYKFGDFAAKICR